MRIFDCFTFFTELEILELRLMELAPVVDTFVIVEATRTHRGQKWSPVFARERKRFAPWLDQIVHVVVDDLPLPEGNLDWRPENAQRNAILRGLTTATSGDMIMVSDVDEIPHRHGVLSAVEGGRTCVFEQAMYYYYVNARYTPKNWYGTVMAPYGTFESPQALRDARTRIKPRVLSGAHLSYMGGLDRIEHKTRHTADGHAVTGLREKIVMMEDPLGRGLLTIGDPAPLLKMSEFLTRWPRFALFDIVDET